MSILPLIDQWFRIVRFDGTYEDFICEACEFNRKKLEIGFFCIHDLMEFY